MSRTVVIVPKKIVVWAVVDQLGFVYISATTKLHALGLLRRIAPDHETQGAERLLPLQVVKCEGRLVRAALARKDKP